MLSSEVLTVRDNGDSLSVYVKIIDGDIAVNMGDSYIDNQPCIRFEFSIDSSENVQQFVTRVSNELDSKITQIFDKQTAAKKHRQAFQQLYKTLVGNIKKES